MHPLLAVDNQAYSYEDKSDTTQRPTVQNQGRFICVGPMCNALRRMGKHRRGMVRKKEALCDLCRKYKLSVTMAYDIEQMLQHLPEMIQRIVTTQTDSRIRVVQAIARKLEWGTTYWTRQGRIYVTERNRAARRISKTLLLRTKGALTGAPCDLTEAERSNLDTQSIMLCNGKCKLKEDKGERDDDSIDGEENRLCRTCGHLLPWIDIPTNEAMCRAAPTGLCPCCGLEDDAQTSMARPCGVCRSWWLLRNHNSDQRRCEEAEAAPVEDFGKGPHMDPATGNHCASNSRPRS
jgi:hypothetical protein